MREGRRDGGMEGGRERGREGQGEGGTEGERYEVGSRGFPNMCGFEKLRKELKLTKIQIHDFTTSELHN